RVRGLRLPPPDPPLFPYDALPISTSPDEPHLHDRMAEGELRRRDRTGEARCQYRRLWCTGEQQLFADGQTAVVAHPPGGGSVRFRLDGQRGVFVMGAACRGRVLRVAHARGDGPAGPAGLAVPGLAVAHARGWRT